MKKLLLICLLCCVGMVARAQLYLGGSFGVGNNSILGYGTDGNSFAVSLAPEIGGDLNKWASIGTSIAAAYGIQYGEQAMSLNVSPYFRGKFAHVRNVDFFADAVLDYQFLHDGDPMHSMGVGIRPGFLVHLSDHLSLQARAMLLQYAVTLNWDRIHCLGFSLANSFSVGVLYNF